MDGTWWTAEPGGLFSDPEWRTRTRSTKPERLSCDDCGVTGTDGYTLVGSTGKVLCGDCSRRRGIAYLFDARDWTAIARALQGKSA